jgi:hypothetical protein
MGFLNDHAVVSTVASVFLVWLISKTVALLRDRQRIGKFVSHESNHPAPLFTHEPVGYLCANITPGRSAHASNPGPPYRCSKGFHEASATSTSSQHTRLHDARVRSTACLLPGHETVFHAQSHNCGPVSFLSCRQTLIADFLLER